MHGFEELARLLAAPSIAAPKARRGREGAPRERKKPHEHQGSPNPEDFEYIEVGDPRDGP